MPKQNDVLAFLAEIIPDTPEMRLIEKQQLVRFEITQLMRDARKKAKLSRKQMAKRLGVSVQTISDLEDMNCDRGLDSVVAYFQVLECDIVLTVQPRE